MATKHRILISTSSFGQVSPLPISLLEQVGVEYVLNPYGRKLKSGEIVPLLRGCDGVIAGTEQLDRTALSQAPHLQVISRCGVGLDNVDLEAAHELGIQVFSTPAALADAVSELTVAGMLSVLRQVEYADSILRKRGWEKPMGRLLRGKTVGIVGLGRIGKAVVRLLQPFGVTVVAYDPRWDDAFAEEFKVKRESLDDLLTGSDIVTLHLTYSPEAHHLLDRARLSSMKPSAILINCARGGLVDEDALCELMKGGHLYGAYLDTFEEEPYLGPLVELPNVLLTSHIGSYASECRASMELEAVQNVIQYFAEKHEHEASRS